MMLCLDVGNTHIFGGVYVEDKLHVQFRYSSSHPSTSDQLGIFFKTILRENQLNPQHIKQVAICSVVPSLNYSIRAAFLKYFELDPFFLDSHAVMDLTIGYRNPHEIGADRLSAAIAAAHHRPHKNLIIVDLGTATTFDAIAQDKTYLTGLIIPGIYISMKALYENTAKLLAVNIIKPETVIGETTAANIQSGLYYSHLGAAREIIKQMSTAVFQNEKPTIIGTGGFAYLFERENLFDEIIPDLVLQGLYLACQQNT